MKNLFIFFIVGIFLISFASAEIQSLGTFKKGETINLKQVCENCTYNNITSVLYPNSTTSISNIAMTKSGVEYTYSYSKTDSLGEYIVYGFGDLDGTLTSWAYTFQITKTGINTDSILSLPAILGICVLIIFLIVLSFKLSQTQESLNNLFITLALLISTILSSLISVSISNNYPNFEGIASSIQIVFIVILGLWFILLVIRYLLKAIDYMNNADKTTPGGLVNEAQNVYR